jgi:hypothetical protein
VGVDGVERVSCGLPVGTVTFLLTDVEGSTRLWEATPQAMSAAGGHAGRTGTDV